MQIDPLQRKKHYVSHLVGGDVLQITIDPFIQYYFSRQNWTFQFLEENFSLPDILKGILSTSSTITFQAPFVDFTYPGNLVTFNLWAGVLPKIDFRITFNVTFNFNLVMHLNLDYHFDLNIPPFVFPDFQSIIYQKFNFKFPKVEKAKYGISKYGYAIYDPPGLNSAYFWDAIWDLAKKLIEPSGTGLKYTDQTAMNYINWYINKFTGLNVLEGYAEGVFKLIDYAYHKIVNASYVGFIIVGLTKVLPRKRWRGGYCNYWYAPLSMPNPDDMSSTITIDTASIYENHVGLSRVGYFRVWSPKFLLPKELGDNLKQRLQEFKNRVGYAPIKTIPPELQGCKTPPQIKKLVEAVPNQDRVLHQRIFIDQRRDKIHWHGGKHQIRLQRIINEVKRILNNNGVFGSFRLGYLAFAQEVYYMYYNASRRWKRWKQVITEDDLIDKYKSYGLDETLLNKIKEVVVNWRPPDVNQV